MLPKLVPAFLSGWCLRTFLRSRPHVRCCTSRNFENHTSNLNLISVGFVSQVGQSQDRVMVLFLRKGSIRKIALTRKLSCTFHSLGSSASSSDVSSSSPTPKSSSISTSCSCNFPSLSRSASRCLSKAEKECEWCKDSRR